MNELRLVSPIPPSVNHYLGYRAIIKNRRPMAMSYCTQEAKKYKKDFTEYVTQEAISQGWEMLPGTHLYVDCVFYFPRVDMDASNYSKCAHDAITESGVVWEDDNIVCERVQRIYYDSANPRIEMVIHPVDYIGVFDDASQMKEFESVCVGCQRYKRNCSILVDLKKGKLREEYVNNKCIKCK